VKMTSASGEVRASDLWPDDSIQRLQGAGHVSQRTINPCRIPIATASARPEAFSLLKIDVT
jgi:hypothetical protein